jgi:hypothetical protein
LIDDSLSEKGLILRLESPDNVMHLRFPSKSALAGWLKAIDKVAASFSIQYFKGPNELAQQRSPATGSASVMSPADETHLPASKLEQMEAHKHALHSRTRSVSEEKEDSRGFTPLALVLPSSEGEDGVGMNVRAAAKARVLKVSVSMPVSSSVRVILRVHAMYRACNRLHPHKLRRQTVFWC